MIEIFKFFGWSPCRACEAICSDERIFCEVCWLATLKSWERRPRCYELPQGSPPVRILTDWRKDQDLELSLLSPALKGGARYAAWKEIAAAFCRRHPEILKLEASLVPVPPSRPGERDHAYLLSRALSEILAKELRPLWSVEKSRGQRGGTRAEREGIQFVGPRDLSLQGAAVILVDDVITTGATVCALSDFLKSQQGAQVLEIWALTARRADHEHVASKEQSW